ncbi:MAG: OmpA family protein, partial [Chitinophagales bacterium]|nr:OmpA family protein [Chitinophagales bacterium]
SYYVEGNIYFDEGKTLLSSKVEEILDGIIVKLKNEPNTKLKIKTYADANRELNIGDLVAKMRAEEITKYLMENDILFSQLEVKVMGNKELENGCYDGKECGEFEHQENRRAELSFVK